ncbi:Ankyrin repeat-containing protein [Lachnellula hyalina]|uniref:Ankyrin repeat-containing protein n=1 Tax=Lachnellula hyalina TaxID=1316788 RepID=A0A8H8QVU4_9HELO|nr:Ankyrin repeat-containing protein [Lachnellula hyalina]TVY22620.1 Ankyrin repeat-containing protein [Lachnellula hyalina]
MATTHQQEEVEGASPGEQLIEACRRNNTDLLQSLITAAGSPTAAASLLNDTKTVLGNHAYHEAALRGNYEIIDLLLDQDLFECDPLTRLDADTPLHSAIRYLNTLPLPLSPHNLEYALGLITMMLEAGSDPRIRNKAHLTPAALCDPGLGKVREVLEEAVFVQMERGGFDEEEEVDGAGEEEEEAGSDSGSDFDREELEAQRGQRNGNGNSKGF